MAALGIEENAEDKRLRAAACLLADIGWRAHPDYRGEQSLNIISNAAFVGIDHPGRAYLALAVYYRHAGLSDEELGPGIRELAPLRYRERARALAAAFRVGYLVSGAVEGVLPRTTLRRSGRRSSWCCRPISPTLRGRGSKRAPASSRRSRASRPGSSSRAEAIRQRRGPGAARRRPPSRRAATSTAPGRRASAPAPARRKAGAASPCSAGTSASSSAAICSSSSVLAMMRAATPCASATILRSTFRSSAAALACSGAARWRGMCGS